MVEHTSDETLPNDARYVTLHSALLEHLLQRLGWSYDVLAVQMNAAYIRGQEFVEDSGEEVPAIAVPEKPITLVGKNISKMLQDHRVEKRTHACMVVALQKGVAAWRAAHNLTEDEFPSPQTLNENFLEAGEAASAIDTIEGALRLSARLLKPGASRADVEKLTSSTFTLQAKLVEAIVSSPVPKPLLASVTNAENILKILQNVSEKLANKGASPISKVLIRSLAPKTFNALAKMNVVGKDAYKQLTKNIAEFALHSIGEGGPVVVDHVYWPRLLPFWAWMYDNVVLYGPTKVGDDGLLSTFSPSTILFRNEDSSKFDRIQALLLNGALPPSQPKSSPSGEVPGGGGGPLS